MTDSEKPSDPSCFQGTNPSELRRAGSGDVEALASLIGKYQTPLMVYLLHAFPALQPRAAEILQDFAQDRLLREGWLGQVDLNRGRFRDFLRTSLRNYALNWLRNNQKESRFASLEGQGEEGLKRLEMEIAAQTTAADDAFDLEWLRAILSETLSRMEEDCRQPGKQQPRREQTWEIFNLRVLEPVFEDTEPVSYEELVNRFGLKDPAEGANLLLSAKRIFERHLFEVISEHEREESRVRAEMEDLKQVLARLAGRG
jgi:DNA-directed RNA polymerase specialized sigma24 family protein